MRNDGGATPWKEMIFLLRCTVNGSLFKKVNEPLIFFYERKDGAVVAVFIGER